MRIIAALHHDLVQRVLDDSLRAGFFQARDDVAHRGLFEDRIHGHPLGIAQLRNGRIFQGGQHAEYGIEISFSARSSSSPTLLERVDRAFEQHFGYLPAFAASSHRSRTGLFAINCVFDSRTVSTMRSLFARSDEPVSVTSTMASANSGGFTSVAPQLNSTFAVHAIACQIAFRRADKFRRDDLAVQILNTLERRGFGNGKHPANFSETLLGVNEIGDGLDLGLVLFHPIAAR